MKGNFLNLAPLCLYYVLDVSTWGPHEEGIVSYWPIYIVGKQVNQTVWWLTVAKSLISHHFQIE